MCGQGYGRLQHGLTPFLRCDQHLFNGQFFGEAAQVDNAMPVDVDKRRRTLSTRVIAFVSLPIPSVPNAAPMNERT